MRPRDHKFPFVFWLLALVVTTVIVAGCGFVRLDDVRDILLHEKKHGRHAPPPAAVPETTVVGKVIAPGWPLSRMAVFALIEGHDAPIFNALPEGGDFVFKLAQWRADGVVRFTVVTLDDNTTRLTRNDRVRGGPGEVVVAPLTLPAQGPQPTPPAAPSWGEVRNLFDTPGQAAADRLEVLWRDESSDEEAFIILRRQPPGPLLEAGRTPPNVTSFVDRGLSPGTSYAYVVAALNGVGRAQTLDERSAVTGREPQKTATRLEIVGAPKSAAAGEALTADALLRDEQGRPMPGYTLHHRFGEGPWATVLTDGAGAARLALTAPTPPATQRLALRVVFRGIAEFLPSEAAVDIAVSPRPTPPSAPGECVASAVLDGGRASETSLRVSWRDLSSNETGFVVHRSRDGKAFAPLRTVPADINSCLDASLEPGATYHYQVVAYNDAGESATSNRASATTASSPPPAPAQVTLTAREAAVTAPGPIRLDISLSASGRPLAEATVEVEVEVDGTRLAARTDGSGHATLIYPVPEDLPARRECVFVARFKGDKTVTAAESSALRVTADPRPAPPPEAPGGLVARNVPGPGAAGNSPYELEIAWKHDGARAAGFAVYRGVGDKSGGAAPPADLARVTTLPLAARSWRDPGLAPGSVYWYAVTATAARGEGESVRSNTARGATDIPKAERRVAPTPPAPSATTAQPAPAPNPPTPAAPPTPPRNDPKRPDLVLAAEAAVVQSGDPVRLTLKLTAAGAPLVGAAALISRDGKHWRSVEMGADGGTTTADETQPFYGDERTVVYAASYSGAPGRFEAATGGPVSVRLVPRPVTPTALLLAPAAARVTAGDAVSLKVTLLAVGAPLAGKSVAVSLGGAAWKTAVTGPDGSATLTHSTPGEATEAASLSFSALFTPTEAGLASCGAPPVVVEVVPLPARLEWVGGQSSADSVRPGQKGVRLLFTAANNGGAPARELSVTPVAQIIDAAGAPLTVTGEYRFTPSAATFETLSRGEKKPLAFDLEAEEAITSGEVSVLVDIAFHDGAGRRTARSPVLCRFQASPLPREVATRCGALRDEALKKYAGGAENARAVQKSVDAGLSWLAMRQARNGSWDDRAVFTALALLPFYGHCETSANGPRQNTVRGGLSYLLSQVEADGAAKNPVGHQMYNDAILCLALAEAALLESGDARVRPVLQRCVDHLAESTLAGGGWRYLPRSGRPDQVADTSVTGWALLALSAARRAGANVPEPAVESGLSFLRRVTHTPDKPGYQAEFLGRVGYATDGDRHGDYRKKKDLLTMTAVGLAVDGFYHLSYGSPEVTTAVSRAQAGAVADTPFTRVVSAAPRAASASPAPAGPPARAALEARPDKDKVKDKEKDKEKEKPGAPGAPAVPATPAGHGAAATPATPATPANRAGGHAGGPHGGPAGDEGDMAGADEGAPGPGDQSVKMVNYYLWYYASLGLFRYAATGPEDRAALWTQWSHRLLTELLPAQRADGSWPDDGRWNQNPVYTTALALLSLEVFYRYAPES